MTGGKTGGHIYPLINLKKEYDKYYNFNFTYIGLNNSLEEDVCNKLDINFIGIDVISSKDILGIYKSIKKIKKIFLNKPPDIVISSGGFVSISALFVASKLNIKYYLLEENIVLGRTTKIFKRKCNHIFLTFPYKKTKKNMSVCGNPITSNNLNKDMYSTNNKKTNILIIGGSLGSSVMCDIGVNLSKRLNDTYNIILVCGNYYSKYYKFEKPNLMIYKYIEDIYNMIYHCDIIISRCGSATLCEIISLNKLLIAIPSLSVAKNHQYKNALYLYNNNACLMVDENNINYHNLIKDIINIKSYYNTMINAQCSISIPNSAKLIIDKIGEDSGFY